MPIDRSSRLRDQSVAMERADDIELVFAALERVAERGLFTRERALDDVAEEVGYQLIVHPDWVRPHVERLVRDHGTLGLTFDWQCVLMDDVPETLLEHLLAAHHRNRDDETTRLLLMASRTPTAMEALAETAREHGPTRRDLSDLGFDLPERGPARQRFTIERRALRFVPGSDALSAPHAVGLPLEQVVAPGEAAITFHYLSVTPAEFAELPVWRGQAHLVSVRNVAAWTAWTKATADGRVRLVDLRRHDDDHSLDELNYQLDEAAAMTQPAGAVELLPIDDQLTFANQHVELTPDVIGVLGGPPLGLGPTPSCVECGRLMFHIGETGHSVREYGEGFRSLFICESCRISATVATLWN
jgi:hypothetical protein